MAGKDKKQSITWQTLDGFGQVDAREVWPLPSLRDKLNRFDAIPSHADRAKVELEVYW